MLRKLLLLFAVQMLIGLPLSFAATSQSSPDPSSLLGHDLAASLQTQILRFFQGACDPKCCGQTAIARTSPLPCCKSCNNLLHGETLGLPFSIATCPCRDGQLDPRCCLLDTVTSRLSKSQPQDIFTFDINGRDFEACICSDGKLRSECCGSSAGEPDRVPPHHEEGFAVHGGKCDCGNGKFSDACCANATDGTGERACFCPGSGSVSPDCCPVFAAMKSFQSDLCSCGDGNFAAGCCEVSATNGTGERVCPCSNGGLSTKCCPIFAARKASIPRRCDCGDGSLAAQCCGPHGSPEGARVHVCYCPETGGLSPLCCPWKFAPLRLVQPGLCDCGDGSFSATCCVASADDGDGERVCQCPNGGLSTACCSRTFAAMKSFRPDFCDCGNDILSSECCSSFAPDGDGERQCLCPNGSLSSECCGTFAIRSSPFLLPKCLCVDGEKRWQCCFDDSNLPDGGSDSLYFCADGVLSQKCYPRHFERLHQEEEDGGVTLDKEPNFEVQVTGGDGKTKGIPACVCPDGTITTKCPCGKLSSNAGKSEL